MQRDDVVLVNKACKLTAWMVVFNLVFRACVAAIRLYMPYPDLAIYFSSGTTRNYQTSVINTHMELAQESDGGAHVVLPKKPVLLSWLSMLSVERRQDFVKILPYYTPSPTPQSTYSN